MSEYGWYLCLDDDKIIGGLGVIENDFHDRKDLTPADDFIAGFQHKWEVEECYRVLKRRSNRKSYTREGFIEMLKYYPLVIPKIYVSLF